MATILSKKACEKIKNLNKRFHPFAEKGWMCEGSEDGNGKPCNCLFNNDTDEYFLSSYNGQIISKDLSITPIANAIEMAKIQGAIRLVIENE